MNTILNTSTHLHSFLHNRFWDGYSLLGPDQGVRFNRRVGRFIKSILPNLPWKDNAYYLQAQGYWVLSNWLLFDIFSDEKFAGIAVNCSNGILKTQQPAGFWIYPHSGWEGRIATVELVWASLGLLESYARIKDENYLTGAIKAYLYLIDQIGFQKHGNGLAINYFAHQNSGTVPNNTTLALPFFAKLAQVTGDKTYLKYCTEMISFLSSVQLETGEFPYAILPAGKDRGHYQCYQYNAFELQDLAMYYQLTSDASVLPMIRQTAKFLDGGVLNNGRTRFDCAGHNVEIVYNSVAIAAALGIARRMKLVDSLENENGIYRYVMNLQDRYGAFPFSVREYVVLKDGRYYPRPMSMILYHFLLKALDEGFFDREKLLERYSTNGSI